MAFTESFINYSHRRFRRNSRDLQGIMRETFFAQLLPDIVFESIPHLFKVRTMKTAERRQ